MKIKILTILFLLSFSSNAQINNEKKLLKEAIKKVNLVERTAFTMEVSNPEKNVYLKTRFNPQKINQKYWSAINPTLQELSKKQHTIMKALEKNGIKGDNQLYHSWLNDIDLSKLDINSSDENYITFFIPLIENGVPKNLKGKLDMTIHYNKNSKYIEKIELIAPKPFKYNFAAKATHVKIVYHYQLAGEYALLVREENDFEYTAFLKQRSEKSYRNYSDFQFLSL